MTTKRHFLPLTNYDLPYVYVYIQPIQSWNSEVWGTLDIAVVCAHSDKILGFLM